MYFNLKYKRVGSLFQGTYKASRITSDAYLLHISRYIHLNPRTYRTYRYSSLAAYLGGSIPSWLNPYRLFELFGDTDYASFVEDYADRAQLLDDIKHELANM